MANKDPAKVAKDIIAQIGAELQMPLNYLGVIAKFNRIDVLQSQGHIKISCQTYLDKVLVNVKRISDTVYGTV